MNSRESQIRSRTVGSLVLAMIAVAAGTQVWAQVVRSGATLEHAHARKKLELVDPRPAERGRVLTADGEVLAENDRRATLSMRTDRIPRSQAFFMDLSAATGIPAADLMDRSLQSKNVEWPNPLTPDQIDAVTSVKTRWMAHGISVNRGKRRLYPLGPAASTLVGWFQEMMPIARAGEKPSRERHLVPTNGIEKIFDRQLRGVDGKLIGMADRSGNFLPLHMDPASREAQPGEDITLTIRAPIQQAAFDALAKSVTHHGADYGVAIAVEPTTGDVLAMAQYPSPAPDRPDGMPVSREARSAIPLGVSEVMEPGSVLKVFSAAEALDAGKIDESTTWKCSGSFQVLNRRMKCAHHKAHGVVNVKKGIAESCNLAASSWARLVGWDSFTGFMKESGMLDSVNWGMPGESAGLYNNEPTALTLATMGFGQSMQTTPAGLVSALTMLGNQGTPMRLRLVDTIGGVKQPLRPGKPCLKPETASQMLRLMKAVFEEGTAKTLRMSGYALGGKTGTAERQGKTGYVANFVGFVPAEKPQAVILVMVNNPTRNGDTGGVVAGPVFSAIAKATVRALAIPPTLPTSSEVALNAGR